MYVDGASQLAALLWWGSRLHYSFYVFVKFSPLSNFSNTQCTYINFIPKKSRWCATYFLHAQHMVRTRGKKTHPPQILAFEIHSSSYDYKYSPPSMNPSNLTAAWQLNRLSAKYSHGSARTSHTPSHPNISFRVANNILRMRAKNEVVEAAVKMCWGGGRSGQKTSSWHTEIRKYVRMSIVWSLEEVSVEDNEKVLLPTR